MNEINNILDYEEGVCSVGLKTWFSNPIAYSNGNLASVAHGLEIDPEKSYGQVFLKALQYDNGYPAGTTLNQLSCDMYEWADVDLTPKITSTNISVQIGEAHNGIIAILSSGGQFRPSPEKWGLVFKITYLGGKCSDSALVKTKLDELENKINEQNNKINELKNNSTPAGTIAYYAATEAPQGYLKCNGVPVSRQMYPNLFAAIGEFYGRGDGKSTFNLPDLRGEFIRGLDEGRGVDANRVFGTVQGDAIRNITGSFYNNGNGNFAVAKGVFSWTRSTINSNSGGALDGGTYYFDASNVVPTASENRPRNIALLACIKY